MKTRLLVTSILAFTVAGCATVPIERAQGVSSSGKQYVETLKEVNNLALDESIKFSANLLPRLSRTEDVLVTTTDEIKKRAQLIGQAHEYYDALATYFAELEALANGDQSESTANALSKVADSLKAQPVALELSDDKKKALTGLTGFVAKQVHAAAVEKALVRDADTVAQALTVSEQMLDEQIRWISVREKAERDRKFNSGVKKPFISGAELGSDWKDAWSSYVRTAPVIALLTDAKKASVEMQRSWINILRAQYSHAETLAALKKVKEGLEAVSALRNAR